VRDGGVGKAKAKGKRQKAKGKRKEALRAIKKFLIFASALLPLPFAFCLLPCFSSLPQGGFR